jgi:hypothetical protein
MLCSINRMNKCWLCNMVNLMKLVGITAFMILGITVIFSGCSSEGDNYVEGYGELPEVIDFNLHVRSILSESCFACHGPDEMTREAGLRLDTEEGALSPIGDDKDRYAIIPGSPDDSEIYKRVMSDDPDYMMPTPTSNLPPLNEWEVAVIKKWIEQGAEYKRHWAFVKPEKPDLPVVQNTDWPELPIDYFILEQLEEHGLSPSQEAKKETILRRVSFDLTGLPPTIEELNNFLNDDSPDAYEKVVDRLLASDAYGERMASEWMDAARYADTHGYEDDSPNEMWPWREWLIDAFNSNMPFDKFTTWQLAGDLLPDATKEQKLATGFNRLHQQTGEGGIIEEEYRVEYVADRVYTTGTAFLAVTMQCARCHDHKYDPVSEVEYYEFASFFDNNNERGKILRQGAAGPVIQLPDDETQELINYFKDKIENSEQSLQSMQETKNEDFFEWYSNQGQLTGNLAEDDLVAHLPLEEVHGDSVVAILGAEQQFGRVSGVLGKVNGIKGKGLEFSHGNYINLGRDIGSFERTDSFSFSFWIHPPDTSAETPVIVKTGNMNLGYRGYDVRLLDNKVSARLVHGWPYNAIQIITSNPLPKDEWSHVAVTYDGSSKASGIQIYVNGSIAESEIEHDNLFKNIVREVEEDRDRRPNLFIARRDAFGEQKRIRYEGLQLAEIKLFNTRLSKFQILSLVTEDQNAASVLLKAGNELNQDQQDLLFEHYLLHFDIDFQNEKERLRQLRIEKSSIRDTLQEVMVMQERLNPRQTYVRERGAWDQIGEKVSPSAPKSILEFSDDLPRNRLGLAEWILSSENPLTSRVIVNRYWKMFFGEGLVDTPDDFGNQGSMPTHPELLDWLAVTFRENGWDIKNLHKQVVMSQTYRQSSRISPELLEMDPDNRLFARGPMHRLTAEMIRDNALAASGLLVDKLGGPSVFPYQPEGLWEETTSGRYLATYVESEGEDLYRRSVYTFLKRTSPPPGMVTFDAAPRTHPVVSRQQTNTPLQALHTMNDRIYVEASRVLAERMIKEGGDNLSEQIEFAFLAVLSRSPDEFEIEELLNLYNRQINNFVEYPEMAEKLLSVGEYPKDPTLDAPEVAARTVIANTILNLHETLIKF